MFGRSKTPKSDSIAIVTVHGTGDTAQAPDGDKWFQRGSAFSKGLIDNLSRRGIAAEIVPHFWTGANSAQARELGAEKLATTVRKLAKTHDSVHVIGHSHGGNVASEAATMLRWVRGKKGVTPLASISTVGTPFFRTKMPGGIVMQIFLGICVISVLTLLFAIAAVFLVLPQFSGDAVRYAADFKAMSDAAGDAYSPQAANEYVRSRLEETRAYGGILKTLAIILPLAAFPTVFVIGAAVRQATRARRLRRKQDMGLHVFSLWHPHDEAIAFLQRVEKLKIEPFPRGSFFRASRTSGMHFGVRAVFFMFFLPLLVLGIAFSGFRVTDSHYELIGRIFGFDGVSIFGGMTTFDLTVLITLVLVSAPGFVFAMIYLLVRVLHGGGGEIVGRAPLNGAVGNALRGLAFGRDGDVLIDKISAEPHCYGCRPHTLDGEVAERMKLGASNAASALIEKYRWDLFTVGSDSSAVVNDMATDVMTWKSLIHTTYFQQPEVIDALSDHIATAAADDRAARSPR